MRLALILIYLLPITTLAAPGDQLHVAERLYLSMTDGPNADAVRVRLLQSGDTMQEVSRQGDYIEVELNDGTRGWVRASFVTADEPAAVRVRQLQAEVDRLQQQIDSAQTESEDSSQAPIELPPPQTIENPETLEENERLKSRVAELETELATAQRNNQAQEENQNNAWQLPIKKHWLILIGTGLLIIGGLAGFSWRSRQVRQRLHGLDI